MGQVAAPLKLKTLNDSPYLVHDLDCNGIKHSDKIESFKNHGDIGKFFSPWIKHEIEKIINNGQE